VPKFNRAIIALAGCAAGLALSSPAALADEAAISGQGTVLEETVVPGHSASGEASCRAPELFNPLVAFKDKRDYFMAPSGDFEDPSMPGWELTGGAAVTGGNSPHAVTGTTAAR
jgi:hypothetical protein